EHLTQSANNNLRNSCEQFLLSFVSQLILITHLEPTDVLNVIPAMNLLFVAGRVAFWVGYPVHRGVGFTLSHNMKDYFLDYDYNVVVLDWETPASDSNYFNAAFNCQIVGAMLSYFVRTLVSMGVNVANIHLVGHSLGAHIVGFCGKNFTNPKIGRISGLDPAGPGFWRNDSRTRLAPTDASLVVVTHTSGGLIKWDGSLADVLQMSGYVGNVEPLGHYDFRPNGGTGQPGCNRSVTTFITNRFKGKANESRNCNHNRATVLPIADRGLKEVDSCQLIAYECDSYDNFYSGKCGDCGTDGHRCRPLEFNLEYWLNDDNII
ncbi:unnamed protein product, partial [Medioppia subpectinata]